MTRPFGLLGDDVLYVKRGSRYKAVKEHRGFPADGVWLVQDGSQRCMIRLGEIKDHSPLAMDYLVHADELCSELLRAQEKGGLSLNDISLIACNFFAKKADEKREGNSDD